MDQLAIKPQALAEMMRLIEDTTISGKIAKDILPELLEGKGNDGVKVGGWRGGFGAWAIAAPGFQGGDWVVWMGAGGLHH